MAHPSCSHHSGNRAQEQVQMGTEKSGKYSRYLYDIGQYMESEGIRDEAMASALARLESYCKERYERYGRDCQVPGMAPNVGDYGNPKIVAAFEQGFNAGLDKALRIVKEHVKLEEMWHGMDSDDRET